MATTVSPDPKKIRWMLWCSE